MQYRFAQKNSKRKELAILHHPKFKIAYDFLLLRAQTEKMSQR